MVSFCGVADAADVFYILIYEMQKFVAFTICVCGKLRTKYYTYALFLTPASL